MSAVTSRWSPAPDPFQIAADLLDPPRTGVLAYHDDPAGFVTDCIRWEPGHAPTAYQLAALRSLPEHRRLSVRGPHGLGKTAMHSWSVLWFALTRDAAGEDWKVPTTASAWRQLTNFLWPEIRKWARQLDWELIGRPPLTGLELMRQSLRLTYGEAFAVACSDPSSIEGVHADQVLYVYDEAKTIPAETYDATEGAFSGAGIDTGSDAYAIASSTPGAPQGRFYEIHARKPGLEDWHAVHVTLADTIAAGRVSEQWAAQRARQWSATSAVYANRVLGEFAASESDGIIALAWVEAANERWHALAEQDPDVDPLTCVGVDVARSGEDRTVIALRYGLAVRELRRYGPQGTMDTAGVTLGILEAHHHPARQITAVIDVIGIGAGVVDRLRETSLERVVAFNASERSERRDRSHELGFTNARAAAWWNLREMLDPDSGIQVALPPDDLLTGDLTAPTWRVMSGGRIQVESKDEIKKRLGRSTDDGDAVVMAFWPEGSTSSSLERFASDPDASFFGSAPQGSRWKID